MQERLIQQFIDGDKEAFEKLFETYYAMLKIYVCRYTQSATIAEDIVQDVFFQLWMNRTQIKKIQSLKSYLYTSAHNIAANYIRRKQVENKYTQQTWTILQNIEKLSQTVNIDLLDSSQFKTIIKNAINQLPEQTKRIFLLSRHYQMKNTEIAEFLDVSIKTVEKHITKSLQQLRMEVRKKTDKFPG